jgi:hypothetical protein
MNSSYRMPTSVTIQTSLPRFERIQPDLNTPYRVMDLVPYEEIRSLGFDSRPGGPLVSLGIACREICAVRTGEYRPPRAGEWYLSGCYVEAYRAPNDLSTSYHIAKLRRYRVKTSVEFEIVQPTETSMSWQEGAEDDAED